MAKIFVEAYGCSASFADSEMISGLIVNGGHTQMKEIKKYLDIMRILLFQISNLMVQVGI